MINKSVNLIIVSALTYLLHLLFVCSSCSVVIILENEMKYYSPKTLKPLIFSMRLPSRHNKQKCSQAQSH